MFVTNADYRDEIGIISLDVGTEPFVVTRGMRIARAVLAPVLRAQWQEVEIRDTPNAATVAPAAPGCMPHRQFTKLPRHRRQTLYRD